MGASPSWDDLRCLEALARTGDVASAARELGLSPSTLYRRIAALEASTDTRCLTRGTGATELTEAGRSLAAGAHRMREVLTRVVGEVRGRHTSLTGVVSLTTVEGMAPFLPAPLATLRERHPELRIDVHFGDRGPSVRRREVDVAIGIMPRPPSDCWGRRLFQIGYGVFGTETVVRATPRWVVLGPEVAHTPEAKWETKHATEVAASTAHRSAFLGLVRAGLGLGLLPRPLASLYPELVEAPTYRKLVSDLRRVAWVLTHESQRKTPRVAALTAVLAEHLAGAPPTAVL